jgi:hypothetical protein
MSWETLYWVSQLLLVVFPGVALISGAIVNKRQSAQLLTLETNLEEQREKTAIAEKSLVTLNSFVHEPRHLDLDKANKVLSGEHKGSVEVKYLEDNLDAEWLAEMLNSRLLGNGWVSSLRHLPAREIKNPGITLITGSRHATEENMEILEEPGNTLKTLLETCVTAGSLSMIIIEGDRPRDSATILIGPKAW